jgi:hypothetical protein
VRRCCGGGGLPALSAWKGAKHSAHHQLGELPRLREQYAQLAAKTALLEKEKVAWCVCACVHVCVCMCACVCVYVCAAWISCVRVRRPD